jgi:hypothetical protein
MAILKSNASNLRENFMYKLRTTLLFFVSILLSLNAYAFKVVNQSYDQMATNLRSGIYIDVSNPIDASKDSCWKNDGDNIYPEIHLKYNETFDTQNQTAKITDGEDICVAVHKMAYVEVVKIKNNNLDCVITVSAGGASPIGTMNVDPSCIQ